MSYLAIKQRLVESSGRYDLTDTDIMSLLNRAQQLLDSKVYFGRLSKVWNGILPASQATLKVPLLRRFSQVLLYNSEGLVTVCSSEYTEFDLRDVKDDFTTLSILDYVGITPQSQYSKTKIFVSYADSIPSEAEEDVTIVARVNLVNDSACTVASSPSSPSLLNVLIEDGLLQKFQPALDISEGTVTIVGTDEDGAALTEEVDCSGGAGSYTTAGRFKTVTEVTPSGFDYLVTGNQKITVLTARNSFLGALDTSQDYTDTTLYFYPTTDETLKVVVYGDFWTPAFTANTDKTIWTERYGDALILAAMLILEKLLRNREGIALYMDLLNDIIADIDREYISKAELSRQPTFKG